MCTDVSFVGKLAGEKDVIALGSELLDHIECTDETALLTADENDLSAIAADNVAAFLTHPIGHVDDDLVAECRSKSGEGYASVAAGHFNDRIADTEVAIADAFLQDC
jgi:hypothetical protein